MLSLHDNEHGKVKYGDIEWHEDRLPKYMKNMNVGRCWAASSWRCGIGAAYSGTSTCKLYLKFKMQQTFSAHRLFLRFASNSPLASKETKLGHQMRRAEFHSTQLSSHCSQLMLPQPLKAVMERECFGAVRLDNIAHSRDRICRCDRISVTARKVPSVQTFSCRTTGF